MKKNKTTQEKRALTHNDLSQFIGTTKYYQNIFGLKYTDGVHYLAEHGEAYWLIDAISIFQRCPEIRTNFGFFLCIQFWKLNVSADDSAQLTCEHELKGVVLSQHIGYTDFPLKHITLYCEQGFLMLPSEY